MQTELTEAREAQTKSKAIQAAKTAGEEATLQQRIAATSRKAELIEQAKVAAKDAARVEHLSGLQSQIAAKEVAAKVALAEKAAAGNVMRDHLAADRKQVEAIRAVKLAEMEAAGIPAKYRAELANKKLVNF